MSSSLTQLTKEEMLEKLLHKECQYYEAILELAHQEQKLLQHNKPFSLIPPIIKKKKILISCVEEIEETIKPLKKYWEKKKKKSDSQSKKVQRQLASLNALLNTLITLDKQNETFMKERFAKLHPKH
ncbi:hypothetical protein JYU14_02605 [Simkania negevensis]|uniref:Uncharacterized protein n=1 Tax=Simkania negevensis TaxID=83561 RepID=A0ABS3AS25_9BACT|nr:hypothetical protein [Simkania negevensis]